MLYVSLISLFLVYTFNINTNPGVHGGKVPSPKCENGKNQSELNSFLWTLDRDPPSYFFGTIHVPYIKVWDYIPENTKRAFENAENIFFELDLTDPYTITALANCQLLPHGENLGNILPQNIYKRLKRHLDYVRVMMPVWMTADQRGRGIYADYLFHAIAGNWERKRPVWVMLMVNSLTESNIKSRGIPVLDLFLAQEAERMAKVTGAVERVEEQCVPLNELNFSQVLFALNQTLWQHEAYRTSKGVIPYTTEDLIQHYNCGDLNAIIFNHDTAQVPNLVNSSLPPRDLHTAKMIDHYFRMELIDKRNQRMAERVVNLLKAHPKRSFFFAFGAGHYLGNNTVIDRLLAEGFQINHTLPDAEIPVTQRPRRKNRKSKKLHKFSLWGMSDFPMPSDFLYEDIAYLFKKRISLHRKLERRHKKQRRKHLRNQDQFEDLWLRVDSGTRMWLERQQKKHRRKYHGRKEPFNDLWIRMDTERPSLLRQLVEEYGNKSTRTTTSLYDQQYLYGLYSGARGSAPFTHLMMVTGLLTLWSAGQRVW